MEQINYKELYLLQDKILDLVFAEETEFYLSGGTCLNRFYIEKRFSEDLDFFTNFSSTFAYSTREIIDKITQSDFVPEKSVDSKDFVRINVFEKESDIRLQVDFVNDRVKRFGDFTHRKGYILDNPLNILSNKISAVIGRDNPKDIFDIYLISRNFTFNWSEILDNVREKLHFQKEDLIYRLQSFPTSLLKMLKTTDEHFLDDFESNFAKIIHDIRESN